MSAESSGDRDILADGSDGADDSGRDGASGGTPTPAAHETRLAAGYRRLLLPYPRGWRAEHGAALMATLLDTAEADGRGRPTPAAAIDLVGNGLATRARPAIGWIPTTGRRAIGIVAIAAGGVLSAVMLAVAEQGPGPVWPFDPADQRGWHHSAPTGLNPLETDGIVVYLPWLVVFGAAVLGLRRLTRTAAIAVLPATAAILAVDSTNHVQRPPLALLATLCLLALIVATVWTAPTVARPAGERRPLALATLLVISWMAAVELFYRARMSDGMPGRDALRGGYLQVYSLYDNLSESLPAAFVVAGLGLGAVSLRRPGWFAAFSITAVAVSPLGFSRIRMYDYPAADDTLMFGLFVLVLVLLGVLDLGRAARRSARGASPAAADG